MLDQDESARVVVPVGGGLDDDTDPWLLEPPKALEARNLVADKRGTLSKHVGYTGVSSLDTDGKVVVSGLDECAVLGYVPPRVITQDNGTQECDPGAGLPHEVTLRRVRAGRGFVHDVQLAHRDGYTMVVYNYVGDTTVYTGTNSEKNTISDFETECVCFDSAWNVVYGPVSVPDIQWLPRVEAVASTGVGSTPVFVIFGAGAKAGGLAEDLWSATAPVAKAYSVTVDTGSSGALSSSTMGDFWPARGGLTGAGPVKYYDTVEDPDADCCYVVFPVHDGTAGIGGKEIRVLRYTASSSAVLTVTATATRLGHLAIGVDNASDTLLVYDGADSRTLEIDATALGSATPGVFPTLLEIDTPAAVLTGVQKGDRGQTPEFYRDHLGLLYLNERLVSITGSSPGSAAYAAGSNAYLPHCYRPLATSERVFAFVATRGWDYWVGTSGGPHIRGAGTLEMYHLENHGVVGSVRAPTVDLPLFESRLGDHNHKAYIYTFDGTIGSGEEPMVTGQGAVTSDGRILIPSACLISAGKIRSSLQNYRGWTDTPDPLILDGIEHVGVVQDGAGYYNDEQFVSVAEIASAVREHSAISVGNTTVVAAGGVFAWGQRHVHPATPRPLQISAVDVDTERTGRRLEIGAVGISDALGQSEVGGDDGTYFDWDYPFLYTTVFVYTDINGQEYRSAPGPWFEMAYGLAEEGGGEDDVPVYCPVIELEVPAHVFSFYDRSKAIDVELYATRRAEIESVDVSITDVDIATATMVCRMPLQRDNDGFFILDTLQDYRRGFTTSRVPPWGFLDTASHSRWASPPHVNPLYTTTGELAADHPPAMSVMAQAGDYMLGLAAEDNHELWISKPLVRGRGPEWSATLTLQAPADCGGVVSIASSYDRWYLLCKNGVWELPALGGPNASGAGAFPPARKIYSGERCVGHMGTVDTPRGVFYLTKSGPRMLAGSEDRDVGRAVEGRLDWENVRDAVYVAEEDRVYWATSSGMVSLDLANLVWTTHDLDAIALGTLGGDLVRVRSDGVVLRADPASYVDGTVATSFTAKYTSPWLKIDTPCADARVRQLAVLVRLENTPTYGSLRVSLEHDYVETVRQTEEWTAAELNALGTTILRVTPDWKQWGSAFRVTVEGVTEEVVAGQNTYDQNDIRWTLVAIELDTQPMTGLARLPAENKR